MSIIVKVTLLFIFSSISFILFALYFIGEEIYRNNIRIETNYTDITLNIDNLINNGSSMNTINKYLSNMGFTKVIDKDILDSIPQRYSMNNTIYPIIVGVRKVNGLYYIIVFNTKNAEMNLYIDYKIQNNNYTNYYIFAILTFITLIFFYILVLKSLLPLTSLRKEVKKFASGNMDIKIISNNKDEIGELSLEFSNAAKKINQINEARILFLRSIMHELKTPITKGRIVTEMIKDKKAKDRLISVFTRLNSIIDEFSKIEAISTKQYKVLKTEFKLVNLIKYINRMLLIENDRPRNMLLHNRDAIMLADFDIMCLAIKNIVDNAIKYSSDNLANIFVEDNSLIIQNKGLPLKDDINKYFEPFYNDGTLNKQKGLGLGMYIIKNTIEFQGFKLNYKYQNKLHKFYIKGCIINKESKLKKDYD